MVERLSSGNLQRTIEEKSLYIWNRISHKAYPSPSMRASESILLTTTPISSS
jgi:hypothetical protein